MVISDSGLFVACPPVLRHGVVTFGSGEAVRLWWCQRGMSCEFNRMTVLLQDRASVPVWRRNSSKAEGMEKEEESDPDTDITSSPPSVNASVQRHHHWRAASPPSPATRCLRDRGHPKGGAGSVSEGVAAGLGGWEHRRVGDCVPGADRVYIRSAGEPQSWEGDGGERDEARCDSVVGRYGGSQSAQRLDSDDDDHDDDNVTSQEERRPSDEGRSFSDVARHHRRLGKHWARVSCVFCRTYLIRKYQQYH